MGEREREVVRVSEGGFMLRMKDRCGGFENAIEVRADGWGGRDES